MKLYIGTLHQFLWDGDMGVVSVERDDGSKVALLVHGPVAESFVAKHVVENGQADLEPLIGMRVRCEESPRGIVMRLALDAASPERERTP